MAHDPLCRTTWRNQGIRSCSLPSSILWITSCNVYLTRRAKMGEFLTSCLQEKKIIQEKTIIFLSHNT